MSRFEFRLKSLLAVRESTRAQRQIELREAFDAQRRLQDYREAVERELANSRGPSPQGSLDIARLQAADEFASRLVDQLAQMRAHEERLAAEIARRRDAVVASDREVRVLEKLRERQFEAFQQEQARAERKHFDEVATRLASAGDTW